MKPFKAICTSTQGWGFLREQTTVKIYFFGLFKKIIKHDKTTCGPCKDEVCLITDEFEDGGNTYYFIKGYDNGGFISKFFIPISEIGIEFKEIEFKKISEIVHVSNN